MKKLLALVAIILVAGNAYSMQFILDPGVVAGYSNTGDVNTQTGLLNQIQLYAETTSSPSFPGFTFNDVGNLVITSVLPPLADDEDLNSTWELSGRWTNLAGSFVPGNPTLYSYTSGTLNLYADTTIDASDVTKFGSAVGSADDTAASFTDGTLVASLSLMGGIGHIWYDGSGNPLTGDTLLTWQYTYMLPNFWRDSAGADLSPYVGSVGNFVISIVDTNTHDIVQVNDPTSGLPVAIHSNHDGSASVAVVPEPTTVILLGSGLLGLAGVSFRKKA